MTERKGQRRKVDQILQATAHYFTNTHDFSKVSIEVIARYAGVSPATIYNNFGTRERLIAETIKKISLESLDVYREIIRSDKPFPDKLWLCLERKIRFTANLDWKVIDQAVSQDKELAAFANGYLEKENTLILSELIESGRTQGYIPNERSTEAIIMYLQILQASGSTFFDIINASGLTVDTAKELNDIILYGLLVKRKVE